MAGGRSPAKMASLSGKGKEMEAEASVDSPFFARGKKMAEAVGVGTAGGREVLFIYLGVWWDPRVRRRSHNLRFLKVGFSDARLSWAFL
jgi:hypothetical protein